MINKCVKLHEENIDVLDIKRVSTTCFEKYGTSIEIYIKYPNENKTFLRQILVILTPYGQSL